MIMLSSQAFEFQCHAYLKFEVFRFVETSKCSDPRIVYRSALRTEEVGTKSIKLCCNVLIRNLPAGSLGTAR